MRCAGPRSITWPGCAKRSNAADRARLGGNPEGLTPEQLLERYLISKETPRERRAELAEAAQQVFDAVDGI